jgi:hypothetical protein
MLAASFRSNGQVFYRAFPFERSCLPTLAIDPPVSAHGMYMFAMRYKSDRCGGEALDEAADRIRPVRYDGEETVIRTPAEMR